MTRRTLFLSLCLTGLFGLLRTSSVFADDTPPEPADSEAVIVGDLPEDTTAPAAAQADNAAEHLLQYKCTTGEVIRFKVEHAANIRMTLDKSTQATTTQSMSTKAWKVLDVLPNGEIEFAHEVEKVRMRNKLDDRTATEYNSETDATPPAGFEQVSAAIGVTLTVFRISPDGRILSRKDKHPQPGNDKDTPMVMPLPKEPVAVGAVWNEPHHITVDLKDGEQARVETRRHFKLLSVKNGVATIELKYQVLTPINAKIESQLVQRLGSGKIRFDIDRGRMLSQQLDVDKRIISFAGPASSMHYRSRFTEKLIAEKTNVAGKNGTPTATKK